MNCNSSLRKRVATEAANLLYLSVEKEYKQAKIRAAKTFGAHFLPANREVAIELDRIADEKEGPARRKRLIQMRAQALKLMKILEAYNPVVVGSVWRGTIHHESDIDITVYHDEPRDISDIIEQNNFRIMKNEWMPVTKRGLERTSFHIYLEFPTKEKAEVTVRRPEEAGYKEKCEIYGDIITGLGIRDLEKTLQENPIQRFVPF